MRLLSFGVCVRTIQAFQIEMLVSYLENKKACVKDARVDENRAKLAAKEELVCVAHEYVVDVEHDDALIIDKPPCIYLVEAVLEPLVEIRPILVWIR